MPLVNTRDMFKRAYEGGYAIGAFNVNNMEIIQGIMEGATAEKSPVILQVSAGARKYANHTYLMKLIEAGEIDSVKVASHHRIPAPAIRRYEHEQGVSRERAAEAIEGFARDVKAGFQNNVTFGSGE